ncbi:hypothetical protein [Rhabdothermincola sediminis]|uniref:hypothetical protein n=1 Tax=Rhabdothermincola sediminis TaxID=2751370 RepID=UPI001AA0326D|nr:hypothetical protein [Rhabdothermincola sediminis]
MGHDPEAAAWERARQRLAQKEAERQRLQEARQHAEQQTLAEQAARHRRQTRRRIAAGAAALVVVAAAVAVVLRSTAREPGDRAGWLQSLGFDESPGDAGPDPDSTTPDRLGGVGGAAGSQPGVTGSSPPSVPTRLDAPDPPRIDTSGDDFERIWRQAQLYEGWLVRHPDPTLAAEIYVTGTPTTERVVELLTQLQREGWRIEVHGYRILGVTLDERPAPDTVILRYADTYTGRDVVDRATGAVIEREDYDGRARLWRLEMRRGDDGRWRAADIQFLRFGDVAAP